MHWKLGRRPVDTPYMKKISFVMVRDSWQEVAHNQEIDIGKNIMACCDESEKRNASDWRINIIYSSSFSLSLSLTLSPVITKLCFLCCRPHTIQSLKCCLRKMILCVDSEVFNTKFTLLQFIQKCLINVSFNRTGYLPRAYVNERKVRNQLGSGSEHERFRQRE